MSDATTNPNPNNRRNTKSYWKDLLVFLSLAVLALFAPFVMVFQEAPKLFTEQLAGMFSSATWSFSYVHNPPMYDNQMMFELFTIVDYPILMVIAVLRLSYVAAIYGHRQGFIRSHIPFLLGVLMFSCIMALCIFVTFDLSLAGLSSEQLIPTLPGQVASIACLPCPALFLAGLICCSRREPAPKALIMPIR